MSREPDCPTASVRLNDDRELLDEYLLRRSQEAFAVLVRRHINLVYFTALRRVGGNRQAAEDVAQTVFIALARKANEARQRPSLAGWLFKAARFAAAQAVRAEQRRGRREQEAHALNLNREEATWDRAGSLIDEAMEKLSDVDREMVLLRYFESRPFADIGAHYGLSADAARRRVERALEKMKRRLGRRGFASAGAALASTLGAHAAQTAPAHLAGQISAAALAKAGWGGGAAIGAGKTAAWSAAWKVGLGASAIVIASVSFQGWQRWEKWRRLAPYDSLRRPEAGAPAAEPESSDALGERSSAASHSDSRPSKAAAAGRGNSALGRAGRYESAEQQLAALETVVRTLSADQRQRALQIYQNLSDVMDSLDPATRPDTGEPSRRDSWRAVRSLLTPEQRVLYDANRSLIQLGESGNAERQVVRNAVFRSLAGSTEVRSLVGDVVRMNVRKMAVQWRRLSGESRPSIVQGYIVVHVDGSDDSAEFKAYWTVDKAGNVAVTEVDPWDPAVAP